MIVKAVYNAYVSPNPDIRSKQRFANFQRALTLYEDGAKRGHLSRLEEEGLIHRFEYTFELAWKTLQDLLFERGYAEIRGPKPVIEKAFQDAIISDGPLWLQMLKSRNEMTYLYDDATFQTIAQSVKGPYLAAFQKFRDGFPK